MKIGDIINCASSLDMLVKAEQLNSKGIRTIFKTSNQLEVVEISQI